MKIAVVVGTRPDLIKTAPVIKEIQKRKNHDLFLINTGQHYDDNMSNNFIKELGIPKPDENIHLVSDIDEALQIGSCVISMHYTLRNREPDIVLVTGDTNTTLASTIAASKLRIPVGHIEAGCRTWDKTQTEEINRILIDQMSTVNFAATHTCQLNLIKENCSSAYLTGHPIVDLLNNLAIPTIPMIREYPNVKEYAFMTLHRRENITDKTILSNILTNISEIGKQIPIIFSCHPHTRKQIAMFGLNLNNIQIYNPVTYRNSLSLIKHAKFVITDSGGIIQEAALLETPCVSLINATGWVETVDAGLNTLVGNTGDIKTKILNAITKPNLRREANRHKKIELYGKPGVSKRLIDILEQTRF